MESVPMSAMLYLPGLWTVGVCVRSLIRRRAQISTFGWADGAADRPPGRRRATTPTKQWGSDLGKRRLGDGRLEQLDRVAGGVLDQDLLAADAGDDVVAEAGACSRNPATVASRSETSSWKRFQPPGAGSGPVGHGLTSSGAAAGSAQHEAKIAAREHREGRRRVHHLREPQRPQ